ncbi:MAG: hypothetical protein ACJAWW_000743 [Sulfurimonas sp.]|jgi:hypothetical protein
MVSILAQKAMGNYFGWIEQNGELIEENYLLRNTSKLSPMNKLAKLAPLNIIAPLSPLSRLGKLDMLGWEEIDW